MRMRPGDRPPVQRFANRPLMWNCCRLEGRSGNWVALRLFAEPPVGTLGEPQVLAKAVIAIIPFDLLTLINMSWRSLH
jgi:hypothetical protein